MNWMKVCTVALRHENLNGVKCLSLIKLVVSVFSTFTVSDSEMAGFAPIKTCAWSGYEPELAKCLSAHQNHQKSDALQITSDEKSITIGIGFPKRDML